MRRIGSATPETDVTERVSEAHSFAIANSREKAALIRRVEDVMMTFGNQDGFFTQLFTGNRADAQWTLRITDGQGAEVRTLFRGRFRHVLSELDVNDEYAHVQAFSDLKTFWDRTKTTRINPDPKTGEASLAYTTVAYILDREFIKPKRKPRDGSPAVNERYGDLFRSLSVATEYAARPIRGWQNAADSADPSIGDNGRYRELFGSSSPGWQIRRFGSHRTRQTSVQAATEGTTAFDLLTAFAVYYNAEFFIDYDLDALVMARRHKVYASQPVAGAAHSIRALLRDDTKISVMIADDDKYDALHVAMYQPPPPAPVLDRVDLVSSAFITGFTDNVAYCTTDVLAFADLDATIETPPSPVLQVDVRSHIGTFFQKVRLAIRMPASETVPLKKRLYRTPQGGGELQLLTEVDGSASDIVFYDYDPATPPLNPNVRPPVAAQSHAAWIVYDEPTGEWSEPIPDIVNGSNTPEGEIFEAIPALTFREIDSMKLRDPSTADIVAFFGLEARNGILTPGGRQNYLQYLREQFIDLFVTTHGLKCGLKGTNFLIGDAAVYDDPSNPFGRSTGFVKSAVIEPIKEETQAEVVLL